MADRKACEKQAEKILAKMEKMGLHKNVLEEYKKEKILNYGERSPLGGILYWMDDAPSFLDIKTSIENKYGGVIYLATHEYTDFGELLDLFYVSKYEEDWEQDDLLLKDHRVFAYVVNLTTPEFSEFGTIGFDIKAGGPIRIS